MKERQKRLMEVYEHLRKYYGVHTKTGFAEAVKYGRTSMSSAMNGNELYLTDSLFRSICLAYPNVFNLNYLLTGKGSLLQSNEEATTIAWAKAKDTFWKDYAVDVVSTSNGNRAVTLDRVATKLKLTVNDEVPANCYQVCITPERWFYGIDYTDGMPVYAKKQEYTISVPVSYVGTTGKLSLSIMCVSPQEEWTTDVSIQAKDASGGVIGAASITAAPFKANRSTEYSGNLFSSGGELGLSLATEWDTPITGEW